MKSIVIGVALLLCSTCRGQITGVVRIKDSTIGLVGGEHYTMAKITKDNLGNYCLYYSNRDITSHSTLTFKGRKTLLGLYHLLVDQFDKPEDEKTSFTAGTQQVLISRISVPGFNEPMVSLYVDRTLGFFSLQEIKQLFGYPDEKGISPDAAIPRRAVLPKLAVDTTKP